jgi:16S rRNA G966 N2-methylase RsmD
VLVNYTCEGHCKPKRSERRHNDDDAVKRHYFDLFDRDKVATIEQSDVPHWYPSGRMLNAPDNRERWALLWRPYHRGITRVSDFFTRRSLRALSAILEAIEKCNSRDELRFVFQSNLLNGTILQQYREAGGGFAKGTYYVPAIFVEREQLGCFERKLEDVIAAQRDLRVALLTTDVVISTQSSTELSSVQSESVDYIFTDPPYADKVQYGELNFLWEAWLGFDTSWHDEEIIVNKVRGKTEADWANMMRQAMAECYRVLKPGRWLSLCYHDTSEGTWALIQDIMAEVGFIADRSDSAIFIDTDQKSWKQLVSDKITRRDLVINFRKPRPGEVQSRITISGDESATTFGEKVRLIIRDFLAAHPGATKDRVYDEVVSRMVRAGQMEAHNFEELLGQVAEPVREPVRRNLFENEPPNLFGTHEIVRWYLKETETAIVDAAESAKEDAAAEKIGDFIATRLEDDPGTEGVHYSDLFEHYVYAVKDKPRRPLAEWLLDYFYKTDAGTYRLPLGEEEQRAKAEARRAGTSRRIKRYLAFLEQGVAVPERERPNDATLAEWIRHCKRSGLYEQGKLLYEKGGLDLESLSEEDQAEVEEDYAVCVRMIGRDGPRGDRGKRANRRGQEG